jgi:hypothetical protein
MALFIFFIIITILSQNWPLIKPLYNILKLKKATNRKGL